MTDTIVAAAHVRRGMRVLDIACGTGEPAISIAVLLQGSGEVVATDISQEPLKVGEQRARERGLTNIQFVPADVHCLPFPDATFDRATCRLGVMFFHDLPLAMREVHRVLNPGGRATFLAWGPMEQPYFEATLGTILRALPELSLPKSGRTMFRFGRPGILTDTLRGTGFRQVEEEFCEIPWNWPGTPEDLWEYFREVTIPFKPLFDAIPPDKQADVDGQVVAAFARRFDGHEVKLTATVVLASATV